MKIKNISDVITNSSTEVFIVRKNKTSNEISDTMKIISDLFSAVKLDAEKKLSWETVGKDGKVLDGLLKFRCSKGDLIITRPEEIYVPESLLGMIEDLKSYDKSVKSVERIKY